MNALRKQVGIGRERYWILADPGYGQHLGDRFEPHTFALLETLCAPDSHALDIGANIGITAIAMAQLAPKGRIGAIEPVPAAYRFLEENVRKSGFSNIMTHNFALGRSDGEVAMQGNPGNLSGSFVADKHRIDDGIHFLEIVRQHRLDDVFSSLGLDRIDFVKMDVEGYELDVLEGMRNLLRQHQPTVLMEMNYLTLNLWRGLSLTDFRDKILDIFPAVYAVHDGEYVDFRDETASHSVLYRHLTSWAFMDIVAGFDRDIITDRLGRLPDIRARHALLEREGQELVSANQRIAQLEAQLSASSRRIADLESSRSWQITAPLRALKRAVSRQT